MDDLHKKATADFNKFRGGMAKLGPKMSGLWKKLRK
jgi:hypothetical protein